MTGEPYCTVGLQEGDERRLAGIEEACFPPAFRLGWEGLGEILRSHDAIRGHLPASCIALVRAREWCGYALMLPERSAFQPGELVLHVYDFAVLPDHRRLVPLWRLFHQIASVVPHYGHALEAEVRESATIGSLKRHFLQRAGAELVQGTPISDPDSGEMLTPIRIQRRVRMEGPRSVVPVFGPAA